jgi:hypothetical protein
MNVQFCLEGEEICFPVGVVADGFNLPGGKERGTLWSICDHRCVLRDGA